MWPFRRRSHRVAGRRGPIDVDVLATVASANEVMSPFSQLAAAVIRIDLVERHTPGDDRYPLPYVHDLLGTMTLGDVVRFRLLEEDVELAVAVQRATIRFNPGGFTNASPLSGRVPPELATALRAASGAGLVCWQEHSLAHGDRVRIRAVVEPVNVVGAAGYRSGIATALAARDDLGPVLIGEILEAPPW